MNRIALQRTVVNYITPSGTNEEAIIEIDVSVPYQAHPDGTGCIWFKRPDGQTYLLKTAQFDTSVMYAPLTDVEVENAGIAEVEAWWQDGTYLWKSPVYKLGIHQSFTTPTFLKEVNEEAKTTLEEIREALTETTDARDTVVDAHAEVVSLSSEVSTSHEEIMEAKTYMEEVQQIAEDAKTSAYNSSITAQADKESAQAAARDAATALENIKPLVTTATASANAAQTYAQNAATQASNVGRYDATYLQYVSQAQQYRDEAREAQIVAVNARNDATSAMNTASDALDKVQDAATEILAMDNFISISSTEPDSDRAVMWVNKSDGQTIMIPQIYDAGVSDVDTWSSSKINVELTRLSNEIAAIQAILTRAGLS